MTRAYIKHIVSHYPENIAYNDEKNRRTKVLGIYKRHYVSNGECVSDMALIAGNNLLDKYCIDRHSIGAIIFCTQTPDYPAPATSGIMQDRLGIGKECLTFDITSGCTGYVQSLGVAKGLIESGQVKNVLLFHSDLSSVLNNANDAAKSVLFGDSVAATFIDGIECDKEFISSFVYGTDGSGYDRLIIRAPSMRNRHLSYEEITKEVVDQDGNTSSMCNSYMDGTAITNFSISITPKIVADVLLRSGLTLDMIEMFFFHQPNKLLLESMRDACKIPLDKFYIGCKNIGNTSSASIPNIINLYTESGTIPKVNMLVAFGIGLSWAGCIVDMSLYE